MIKFEFDVITYTNEFDFIVKTKKQIIVRRASRKTAYNYMHTKYKSRDGYFVELKNSTFLN